MINVLLIIALNHTLLLKVILLQQRLDQYTNRLLCKPPSRADMWAFETPCNPRCRSNIWVLFYKAIHNVSMNDNATL